MNSFRFKLGLLLAVIVGAFIVSQVVYRETITAMHGSVFSAVDTLEIVHRAEYFHSATHMMLYLASHYPVRKDEKTYKEYVTIRESGRNTIDALIESAVSSGHQHQIEEATGRPAGDLRSVFHAFAAETAAFAVAEKMRKQIETARALRQGYRSIPDFRSSCARSEEVKEMKLDKVGKISAIASSVRRGLR